MAFFRSLRSAKDTKKLDTKDAARQDVNVEVKHVEADNAMVENPNIDFDLLDEEVFLASHVESSAVDNIYARKVYIMNRIMNEYIGMTWWQYGLLLVAGVGWFLDNAWLQLVAVILSPAQKEFFAFETDPVTQHNPAFMTLSLYAGLIVGAAFWGYAADIVGRRFSFNATLLIAGVFGAAAGGAQSFTALGGLLAACGFGIGGSLPVDGMLFLEFLPGVRQQMLTLLSVFWPLGQLATSLIGWGLIPKFSCHVSDPAKNCTDTNSMGFLTHNVGWRYVLFVTGSYTLFCFFIRFVVFRIPESPKFLLSKGRDGDAVRAMHQFAKMCGKPLPEGMLTIAKLRAAAGQQVDMDFEEDSYVPPRTIKEKILVKMNNFKQNFKSSGSDTSLTHLKPLFHTFAMGYTTAIIWLLWALIGLAYPLFNAFIVLYLGGGGTLSEDKVYRNYVIVSVCGIPGSLLATWMVDLPRSGRRGAMAIGTLLTGIFLFGFTGVDGENTDGQLAFSCVTSFTQNIMYGVLYCYTPETFPAPLRGAADGVASSLNRIFGLFASIIKIYAPSHTQTQRAIPIYVGAALFILSGLLMLTLRVETAARTSL
ncbi:transmembrane transporter [Malassezia pachydermatis]|uniref:Sugar transporter n=1 Tax=Malassezia pachydermatis TaxID=77020 RepID=A0A0M8MWD8_9BASI|nr:sugar transporter [Malassezia pachydermatis]KOS14891.1 sugar transporter [Malassezia pachydermatis]